MNNGHLPEGWILTTLGNTAKPTQRRVNPHDFPVMPYIGMEHIEPHTMRLLGTVPANEMKSSADTFKSGDVLFGRLRPYLNKVYVPDFDGLCSTEFIIFRQVPHIHSKFLQYFLNSWEFVQFANSLNAGDRPRVKFEQLSNYPFPLPPLEDQKLIVEKIEELFTQIESGIESLKQVQTALKRYKASVLKAACEGRLAAQQPGDEPAAVLLRWLGKQPLEADGLPRLPEGWCWTRFGDLFSVSIGGTPSRSKPEYWGGDVRWVSSGEVTNGHIHDTREKITIDGLEHSNAKVYPVGTVLLAMIGEGKTRGQAAVLNAPSSTNQNVAGILVSETPILSNWVFYWLMSRYEQTRKSGSGGMQYALNAGRIRDFVFPVPPLDEQHRIIAEVERRLSVMDAVEQAAAAGLRRAGRLRQAVLKAAFEGRLV